MKVFSPAIKKQGVGKNGKQYTIVTFKDEGGRKIDTFDSVLLNVVDGQSVDGEVTEEQNGQWTNYKFKMAEKQTVALQFKEVVPEESGADKAVAKAQQGGTVPQEVWEKKDRGMLLMNCNNAAASVFSGTALAEEHLAYTKRLFTELDTILNGKNLSVNYAKVLEQVEDIKADIAAMPPTPPAPVDEQPPADIDLDGIDF